MLRQYLLSSYGAFISHLAYRAVVNTFFFAVGQERWCTISYHHQDFFSHEASVALGFTTLAAVRSSRIPRSDSGDTSTELWSEIL